MLNKIAFVLLLLSLSSCKLYHFVVHNVAEYDDYKIFDTRKITRSSVPKDLPLVPQKFGLDTLVFMDKIHVPHSISFDQFMEESSTLQFLVWHEGDIIKEEYYDDVSKNTRINIFSSSKSILSLLIGCAIDDGYIKTVQDPITQYLPELHRNGFDSIRIIHLLQMTSGIHFRENYYLPYATAGNFYYGSDLDREVRRLKSDCPPGIRYQYSSGDSQILGMLLTRALGRETLAGYLQKRIWDPLGMAYNASWSTDEHGMEKAFCCINTNARNLMKIGQLYLNKGFWNGQQIVSASWIKQTLARDTAYASRPDRQYQWYLNPDGSFYTLGYLGQYLFVDPSKHVIIVRLGKSQGKIKLEGVKSYIEWNGLFQHIAEQISRPPSPNP